MRHSIICLLFCSLPLCVMATSQTETAQAAPELPLFEATYQLSALGLPFAQARRILEKTAANEYLFHTHAETIGLLSWVRDDKITESSRWRFADGILQPLHYEFLHQGKRQKRREVRFDWQNKTAHSRKNAETWELKLQTGTLDMLLSQLALTWELLQNPQPSNRRYMIAHDEKVSVYEIQFNGEERLDTPLGQLNTLKFTRQDPQNEKRFSVLWCAPELHYLPVRIEHTEPGDETVKAEIETIRFIH